MKTNILSATRLRRISLLAIAAFLTVSVADSCSNEAASYEILVTGNIQGAVDTAGARLSTLIAQRRAEMGSRLAVIDGGDFLKSCWYVDYSSFSDDRSEHIFSKFFNTLGFDAVVLGNHDLTSGMPVLNQVSREFEGELLAANVKNRSNGKPAFGTYKVFKTKGLKIAVIGMVNPLIANNFPVSTATSLDVVDMHPEAERWVSYVRKKERPDVLVLVAHSKYDDHLDQNNDLAALLAQIPGIDVCVDSHVHAAFNRDVEGPDGSVVRLVGLNAGGTEAVAINFSKDTEGVCSINVNHIETTDEAIDQNVLDIFGEDLQEAAAFRDEAICQIDTTIAVASSLYGPSAWAALMHEACREESLKEGASAVGIDVSLATVFLEKGEITKGMMTYDDFCKLSPFEDHLCVVEMTAGELRKLLDYNIMSVWADPDNLLYFMDDADAVRYDVYMPPVNGAYVKCHSIDGVQSAEYPDSKVLHVLMSTYRAHDGACFISKALGWKPTLIQSRILWESESPIRTMLIRWCQSRDVVRPRHLNNWTFNGQ